MSERTHSAHWTGRSEADRRRFAYGAGRQRATTAQAVTDAREDWQQWLLAVAGAAAVVLAVWGAVLVFLSLAAPQLPEMLPMPLGTITAVATGPSGRVYVASSTYGRVNIYDSSGEFQRAVPAPGRPFRMLISPDGKLYVGYWGLSRAMSVFSPGGKFLQKSLMSKEDHEAIFGTTAGEKAVDRQGQIYEVCGLLGLGAKVTRRGGDEQKIDFIAQSWGMWLCQAPLPASLYIAGGLAGFFYFRRLSVRLLATKEKTRVAAQESATAAPIRWSTSNRVDFSQHASQLAWFTQITQTAARRPSHHSNVTLNLRKVGTRSATRAQAQDLHSC